MSLFEWSLFT